MNPVLQRMLPPLLLASVLWLAGCDGMNGAEETPDVNLDAELVDLLTIGGQRGLDNFMLPDSDEFGFIPQDPRNPLTADKVALGRLLFHETALGTGALHPSGVGTYSCATCHHAGAGFQAGRRQAIGDGGSGWGENGEGRTRSTVYAEAELDVQGIRTPSVLNSAFQEVVGWSGMFGVRGPNAGTEDRWLPGTPAAVNHLGYDGLESQAIHAQRNHRMTGIDTSVVATNPVYVELWNRVFPGRAPDSVGVGLALAAYERTLLANGAPFQRWLRGDLSAMSDAEKRGALVFFDVDRGGCEVCHTGPALNQVDFYALGMPDLQGAGVFGSTTGDLDRGRFLGNPEEELKFKVPQLYNLKDNPFYGHGATFRTIRDVVDYYNEGVPAKPLPEGRKPFNFRPLQLTQQEIGDLVLFLTESLHDPDLDRYVPEDLPSGQCTPANDEAARRDLGCVALP